MIINILAVGSIKEQYFRNKISEYVSAIKKKNQLNIIEIPDCPIPKNAGERIMYKIKEQEGNEILAHIKGDNYVVALCIEGVPSKDDIFGKLVKKAQDKVCNTITFVIGGSLGLSDSVVKRADYRLSFSPMTFPHQLMRVMLLSKLGEALSGM